MMEEQANLRQRCPGGAGEAMGIQKESPRFRLAPAANSQKQPSGWQATKLGARRSGSSVGNSPASEMSTLHLLTPDTEILVLFQLQNSLCQRSCFYHFSVQDPAVERVS